MDPRPASLRCCLAGGVAAALLAFAPPAVANGRFPAAGQLVVNPTDPAHLVLRATYGILQSEDAGASWRWVCETAVGYGGIEDPAMAITGTGTILAGIFSGLSVSPDRACSWDFVGGVLQDQYVIDVAVDPQTPSRALAVTSSGSQTGFHVVLAETNDSGQTWHQAGVAVDPAFLALTVEVAPSDPQRVYLSGLYGGDAYVATIQRSDDGGQTWTRHDLDIPARLAPFIGAVDPSDPDRLYARVDADPNDELHVSDDGGQTWSVALVGQGEMLGFALSPDGSRLAVGGPSMGVEVASTSDLAFAKTSALGAKCLKWAGDKLFACADEISDGFTVGVSTDEGSTFSPVYHLTDLAPLECAATTPVGAACPAAWPGIAATLGVDTDGAAGGGGGGGGGSASALVGGGAAASPPPGGSSGCALASAGSGGRGPAAALAVASLAAATFLAASRRRRARQARRQRDV